MKKLSLRWPILLGAWMFCAFLLAPLSQVAHAAGKLVMVLPFAVQADMPDAARTVPQAIIDKLKVQGYDVISMERAREIYRASGRTSIDLATAKELGEDVGAEVVIYGAFKQEGAGFTMQTRLVPVSRGSVIPASFDRDSLSELPDVASQLASRVAVALRPNVMVPELDNDRDSPMASPVMADRTSAPVASEDADVAPEFVPMRAPVAGALADVQVRGMRFLDPDVVLMRLSIRRGDTPNASEINEEVKRIWEMGYFTDVQAHMEGAVLVFDVTEKQRIDTVIIEGTDAVDEDDVQAAMTTRSGSVLNEAELAEDLQKIHELYREKGYYLAKATYRLEERAGGQGSALIVTINEGKKLYISEVKVDGLEQMDQEDMNKYLALRKRTLLSWISGGGVLKEEHVERDTNAIAAYGLNEGFVDIQVGSPSIDYQEDGIHIHFPVVEGQRYKLNEISFAGDIADTEENMLNLIQLDDWKAEHEYFSLGVMQEDSKRLENYYNDLGYAYVQVDTRVIKPDEEPGTVNVTYVVKKGQRIFIRRLLVEGNDKTRDHVILREMRLGDGDPYSGAKLRRSSERLNRLRYFDAFDTELVPTDRAEVVDLKVKVREGKTGALMVGVGYSTYFDVGVSGTIMERNLFGKGYQLSLTGFTSWRRTSGTLTFNNPRLYDTQIAFGDDLYYYHDYWDDFTKDTMGDTIRFSFPLGEYTSFGIGYRLEYYEIYDVDDDASPYISDYKGKNWTSAVTAHILRDTTDAKDRPTKGTIIRFSGEYGGGGLGGTDNFVKFMGDWQGFLTVQPDHTLHLRTRAGVLFQNTNDRIPVFERFYVGGMDTVRGYSYTDASPRSTDPKYDNDTIGGDFMGIANFEYVYTFQKDMGLAIVPFFDIGFNVDTKEDKLKFDFDKNWYYSTGLELRWRSPMGDLRIAYGIPLKEDVDGEWEPGRLEFSMGQFF